MPASEHAGHAHGLPAPALGEACPPEVPPARPSSVERLRDVRRVFLITLALNILVAGAKAVYAYLSGSLTLGTDAVHSALDGASNVLALVGMHLGSRPADADHPYGHRKVEILAALGIGVFLVIGMFEFGREAIGALLGHHEHRPDIGLGGFVVLGATLAVNVFVTRYENRKGKELGSALLCADAAHTQSDVYATIGVAVSFLAVRFGLAWADAVGTLALLVLVGRAAWHVFEENIPELVDTVALDADRIRAAACAVSGVAGVHRIRSRASGGLVHVDLHAQVAPDLTIAAAHDIAHHVEDALRAAFPEVADVLVHVEPAG